MSDIFNLAYLAAQKAIGIELWELVPDNERLRAIRVQISKMNFDQIAARPLFKVRAIN
jgi:hypothetical protein